MESSNIYTSSIRNKWDCRTSCTTSKRRNIRSIVAIWIRREVVRFYGMLLLSAECPRPLGRRENSDWKKVWRIIRRTNYSIRCTCRIPLKLRETKREFINSDRRYYQDIFLLDMLWSRENLERRYSDRWYWRIGKIGCIRNFSQMIECKRSPENTNRRRICISCGRWYGKIIRKGLRVPRTPLPRREQTGGEIHGDREESQPAEQKDESEARKDFWSFQEISSTVITLNREFNFMYQKKKHSPFQWNTLVSQGPLVQIWTLPGSWNGSTRFTLLIETPPNGYTWSGRRLTKIQTTSRRLDESWKSRSKKREARMGNRETKIRIYQKFEENLFYWSEWWR